MCVAREFLVSKLTGMPWLLVSKIVKYIDTLSRVLALHTTGNLIVMDGLCLLSEERRG